MTAFIEEFDIQTYDKKGPSKVKDSVIREVPLDIFLNGRKVITIACTGNHIEELALGFLRSEGVIETLDDIDEITADRENFRVDVRTESRNSGGSPNDDSAISIMSSGGRRKRNVSIEYPLESDLTLTADKGLGIMKALLASSLLHRITHGAHCSALADPDGIIAFRDDIGRHNTVDMLGGYALLENIDCEDKILATTGRVSEEIASKAFHLGIPIIISHSVPTSRAVIFSRDAGITLIGYVRDEKMKIYSNERRVIF
ncbi:MAG: formate dehydrogenase accessory sulfurtransferase FdhD [Deltaproteobacteria bacterium]|nr:formate dehydrogenase accessory sulfurtransferase FdhD [Deltaproteobacteria bacterium]MBN2844948.1 formate dehydrogenase accessory sulfurtransferase FdhD [Deltaproteobacteria bacterium]